MLNKIDFSEILDKYNGFQNSINVIKKGIVIEMK